MTMAHGPTAPELATEGKDLSGGYIVLNINNALYSHRQRVHVAPFTNSGGSLLYVTPPSGLFSDAGPDVTAAALIPLVATQYLSDWTVSLYQIFQMVDGEPVEVFPIPTVATHVGTATAHTDRAYSPAGQMTLGTRDTAGHPFKMIFLGSSEWGPYPRQLVVDNAAGNGIQQITHFLAQNGAIRSHAGNKPVAPMWLSWSLNERLRREYKQR